MDRTNSAKTAGLLGIAGNIFLLIIKGIVGFLSGSQAMIADAFNSAGDILSSVFTFIGSKISSKPVDSNHNFGHGKSEYIFSLLISITMILVSLKLLIDSTLSLVYKNEFQFSWFLVFVCIITIITKLSLYFYTRHISKKFKNILVEANSKDHFNDCIITTFTLISALLALNGIYFVDGIIGTFIATWICFSGIKIFIESYNVLMDISIDENTKDIILDLIHTYKDIQKIENLYSTPCGYKYIITLTIFVDGNMSTFDSHKLADNLEKNIKKLDNIFDVIIHVNPI